MEKEKNKTYYDCVELTLIGKTQEQIAKILGISVRAVQYHLKVFHKKR